MCKYCENQGEHLKVYQDFNVAVQANITKESESSPCISASFLIDGGFLGFKTVNIEIPIKYCPICGRRLTKEPVEE